MHRWNRNSICEKKGWKDYEDCSKSKSNFDKNSGCTIIGISIDKDNDKEDVRYLIEFANLDDEIPSNEGYIKEKDIIKKM